MAELPLHQINVASVDLYVKTERNSSFPTYNLNLNLTDERHTMMRVFAEPQGLRIALWQDTVAIGDDGRIEDVDMHRVQNIIVCAGCSAEQDTLVFHDITDDDDDDEESHHPSELSELKEVK